MHSLIRAHTFMSGIFFVLILHFVLAAPIARGANRVFTVGTLVDPDQVLPTMQYSGDNHLLRNLLFPPVLRVHADGKVRCTLCKELPSAENRKASDGTSFVVSLELKKDLKWGDGSTVTAYDIKYTLETMAKASYPKGQHPILPIRRIEIDSSQNLKITLVLKHRRSDAFQLFAISLLPAARAKELESLATPGSVRKLDLMEEPGFTYGPYRVVSATNQLWQLVPSEKTEWEQKPEQALNIRFFATSENLAGAMKLGLIDQTDELAWSAFEKLQSQWAGMGSRYEASAVSSDRLSVLVLNLHSPLLVNPQVRQAIFYAVDREGLSQAQYQGFAEVAAGLLSSGFAKRLEEKREVPYQPQLAARLLDQGGWAKSVDGTRTSENQKLVLTLSCPKGRLNDRWLEKVKTDFAKLGMKLELENPDDADYLRKVVSERRFKDLACVTWELPPLSIPNNIFHSLAIPNRDNNYFGANYSSWDQHVVDKLLDNMLREPDLHHFTRQFSRLEKQFRNDWPAIPLVFEPKITLLLKAPGIQPSEELSKALQRPLVEKKL